MTLPRYPAYKDSGVDWLGEIPEHWMAKPIKHIGRLKGGAGFPHADQGLEGQDLDFHKVNALGKASPTGELLPSDNTVSHETATRLGAFIFPDHSIVFAKVGAALLLGRIREIRSPACIDNNMMGLVVDEVRHQTRFIRYAMELVRFDMIANPGAVPSLNEGQIGNFFLPCPDIGQQTAIAAFLDHETSKIDALIAEQQNLIALLKEKRQAVISHAVTKGLDPDVPMKDSGVEWLGEVPEHWETRKVSRAFGAIGSGTTPPSTEMHWYEQGTIPWVTTGELRENVVGETAKSITRQALDAFSALKLYPPGSLVIAMYGATIGRLAILGLPATTNQACCVLSSPKTLDIKFVYYWLLAFRQSLVDLYATGGGQPNINMEIVAGLRIPAPKLSEQGGIAEFLDRETIRINRLMSEAEHTITLLQERRSALISAAVTGKIDVRNLVRREAA